MQRFLCGLKLENVRMAIDTCRMLCVSEEQEKWVRENSERDVLKEEY